MKKVIDQNGNILPGIVKGNIGGLIVTDETQYQKYIREKESIQKINGLENEVQQLKELVECLIKSQSN